MFNVSWGELAVLTGVSIAFVGRRDLPKAAHFLGTQVGRIVGLLQGARARADRYAAQSELRQLQNELRSGLRDLDAVKSELAISMSPGGMIGRTLGPMTPGAANATQIPAASSQGLLLPPPSQGSLYNSSVLGNDAESTNSGGNFPQFTSDENPPSETGTVQDFSTQSTIFQTTAAVAEQAWVNQGIAFSSAAERGVGLSSSTTSYNKEQAGSVILSKMLQESLIFDQYERVAAEQNAVLQSKVSSIQAKHEATQKELRSEGNKGEKNR
jgi:Sec-independent protein translocase protein TatA